MAEKKYSSYIKALRAREKLLKQQANPAPGEIWNKFRNIAMINPQAAEELTSNEYKIRQAPYEAASAAREEAESQMQTAADELRAQLEAQKGEAEKERVSGVKARAMQEIWRRDHPEWDETRIRLELRKRNMLKYYTKPVKATTASSTSENFWDKLGWHPFGLGE